MATDLQIAANRNNAEKCTGPRSQTGKAISSQNALKTGLEAKSDVIRTENRADFEALTADYYQRYQPEVPEERCLIDAMISSEWLRRRYTRADAAVWERRFEETECTAEGKIFKERADVLARVDQRINSAHRNFLTALRQLTAMRSKPGAPQPNTPVPAESPGVNVATEELIPKLVSFPISEAVAPLPPLPSPDTAGKTLSSDMPDAPNASTQALNPNLGLFLISTNPIPDPQTPPILIDLAK